MLKTTYVDGGVFQDPIRALDAATVPTADRANAGFDAYRQLQPYFDCWADASDYADDPIPRGSILPTFWFRLVRTKGRDCSPLSLQIFANRISSSPLTAGTPLPEDVRAIIQATCFRPSRTIKLSNDTEPMPSEELAQVEPGRVTTVVRAHVYDGNGQKVPNVPVELSVSSTPSSGGHSHHDNDRPKGTLISVSPDSGTSNDDGILIGSTSAADNAMEFVFEAPGIAGDHTISARCVDNECGMDSGKIWVGIRELEQLGGSQYFVPVGDTPNHFDNHYLNTEGKSQTYVLAALYRAKYPDSPLLHLNDASLERGGRFDVSSSWQPPHFEHCRGTEIDVRANDALGAIPERNRLEFEKLARTVGAVAVFEVPEDKNGNPRRDLRHYHVRLTGARPQCP